MSEQTEEKRQQRTDSWIKKISTLEYHALKLCERVMTAYEKELAYCEQELENRRIPIVHGSHVGYKLALEAVLTLQILAGYKPSYRNQKKPRTLEEALRSVELEEVEVQTEQQRCQDYLQKLDSLLYKSQELADRNVQITYDVLTAKLNMGETLTPEEQNAYDWSLDVFGANH